MERNLIEADVINKRPPRRRPRAARVLAFVAALLGLAAAASTASAQAVPKGTVVEIRVEGNSGITAEKIRGKLLSKTNAPFDQQKVDADLRTLIGTKWFTDVQPFYEEKPPGSGEIVLIFRVKEMPILRSVEFRGRRKIPLKEIEENTGLKVGNRADPTRTRLAVQQIERLYVEKGYELAQVSLLEGGEADTTKVVIQIFEGPKYQLASIDFKGNVFATDAQLWNKISSRKPILAGFGGKYHRDMLDEDARKLIEYYQSQGFFEVRVAPVTRPGEGLGDVHLTFVVSEGVRYHVRDLVFEGNSRIKEEQLRDGLQLHSGKPFLDVVRDADREAMLKRYYELGCIKTQIVAEPRFSNEPGVVDLVYKIEESMPFTLGEIVVRGNSRTRDEVIRREFWQAGLLPGEVLDQNRLALAQQRLRNLGYFNENPEMGKQIEVKIVNERPFDKPYRDLMMPLISEIGSTRMQAADEPAGAAAPREIARAGAPAPVAVATTPLSATTSPSANAAPAAAPRVRMQGEDYSVVPAPVDSAVGGADSGPSMLQPFGSGSGGYFSPPADTVPPIRVPAPAAEPAPGFLGAAPPPRRGGASRRWARASRRDRSRASPA